MGHKQSRNQRTENHRNNYPSGDNSGGQTYLSLLPRVISSGIIVFSSAFLVSLITASIVTPVRNSDATQQIQATIDTTGYYVNVSTSDIVNLDLVATPDGATVVGKDTVTTETNSKTGFKLYISSESSTAGSNRLYKDGDSSSDYYIDSSIGTVANPVTLAVNTWGYTLAGKYGNGDNITASSKFVGIPLLNNENWIQTVESAVPTGSGASIDVYYGMKANTAMPDGVYKSKVVYTVLAETPPSMDGEISVSPNYSLLAGGGTITIATGLYTNASDIGEVIVDVGGSPCEVLGTNINNRGLVSITCTLPTLSYVGWKDVSVFVPKFGKVYRVGRGVEYYIPWNDLQYMQDMTTLACSQGTESTASNYTTNQKVLTDIRDGNTYIVRKLKDGNCWMAENLRLVLKEGSVAKADNTSVVYSMFSKYNTDLNTGATYWTGGGTTADFSTATYSDEENPENKPRSYTHGSTTVADGDGVQQQLGGLYNWYVATAGTGVYDTGVDEVVTSSICPYGWMLPYASKAEDKSWRNLFSGLPTDASALRSIIIAAPYSLVPGGGHFTAKSGPYETSTGGWWWSPEAGVGNATAHAFRIRSTTDVDFDFSHKRGTGFSIRCVAR